MCVKSINTGVPERSILGPLIFIIFIGDLPDKIQNQVVLYVDDSSVFSTVKDRRLQTTVARSLNEDLLYIQTWADKWNEMFGAAKCKNLTVSGLKDAETSHPSLTFMNTVLSEVEEVELFGISIRKELSWTHLVDKTLLAIRGHLTNCLPPQEWTPRGNSWNQGEREKFKTEVNAFLGALL